MLLIMIESAVCVLAAGWMAVLWRAMGRGGTRSAAETVAGTRPDGGDVPESERPIRVARVVDSRGASSGPL